MNQITQRTKINAEAEQLFVHLNSPILASSPVIYFTGHKPFSFTDEERRLIRQYVEKGGTILADSPPGHFDSCFHREMEEIFKQKLSLLPATHEIYKSFYTFPDIPPGDVAKAAPLEGLKVGNRLGVIYSRNDYGGCWEGLKHISKDQRELAFQMGTNIWRLHYRTLEEVIEKSGKKVLAWQDSLLLRKLRAPRGQITNLKNSN